MAIVVPLIIYAFSIHDRMLRGWEEYDRLDKQWKNMITWINNETSPLVCYNL